MTGICSDLGLYDLSKIGNLSKVMKEVVDAMVNDDTNAKYINQAFLNCEVVDAMVVIPSILISDAVSEQMKKDQIDPTISQQVLHWMGKFLQSKDAEYYKELYPDVEFFVVEIAKLSEFSFSFTDLLRNLDNALTEAGVTDNPYTALRQKFLAALKDMAYIKCTIPSPVSGIDPAYELCSPGITMVPMTLKLYEELIYNEFLNKIHVEEALKFYQSTAFDKQVEWSRMLKKIEVAPSLLVNPIREEVK